MKDEMEDLLYKHQINLFLVGHQHSYERTCQVFRKKCTTDNTGTGKQIQAK
jgi:hypothetical protein